MSPTARFLGSGRCTYYNAHVEPQLYVRRWRNLAEPRNRQQALATRCVHNADQPVALDRLVARLGNLGVDPDRAEAGVRLAVIGARLEHTDIDGRPAVRLACVGCESNGKVAA